MLGDKTLQGFMAVADAEELYARIRTLFPESSPERDDDLQEPVLDKKGGECVSKLYPVVTGTTECPHCGGATEDKPKPWGAGYIRKCVNSQMPIDQCNLAEIKQALNTQTVTDVLDRTWHATNGCFDISCQDDYHYQPLPTGATMQVVSTTDVSAKPKKKRASKLKLPKAGQRLSRQRMANKNIKRGGLYHVGHVKAMVVDSKLYIKPVIDIVNDNGEVMGTMTTRDNVAIAWQNLQWQSINNPEKLWKE